MLPHRAREKARVVAVAHEHIRPAGALDVAAEVLREDQALPGFLGQRILCVEKQGGAEGNEVAGPRRRSGLP